MPFPPAPTIRLNKLLAERGLCSRREADRWIEQGRVSVDGLVCRELGVGIDVNAQSVCIDGKPIPAKPDTVYLALNKPVGVVTTRRDPQGRTTVMNLIDDAMRESGVFPVGRLDADSEGLLLLTNDGIWSQALIHPSREVWKEYHVEVDKPLSDKQVHSLREGVILDGTPTLPAKLKQSGPKSTKFYISIREGRNRQIRRMCKKVGLNVIRLKRTRIADISLGKLASGHWRPLNKTEIESIA